MPPEPKDPRLALVERFFQGTGNSYDWMVNAATFGIDRLWKRRIAQLVPPRSRRVADLACGTGISTFAIARRLPHCQVVGVELREEYLAIAREKARRQALPNVEFVLSRAEDYRSQAPFDCISSSYLAKYADLPRLVANARDMLEPGGLFLMHDFTYPPKPYLVSVWRLYFKALQRLGSPLFPAWREIFQGLPQLIEQSRWPQELPAALQAHGFAEIRRLDLTLYGSAIVTARRAT
ncbi:methyltransferase domain-containing protein [Ramlibacter henchirensis]|uniref:Methyltransferase domain-containing protein n=1 Tax=Ramlibacter henchirensis TaxID=204072 RepID=A0A4Z0BYJ1_9BURK|nr:class I SAM-dependent methyltransferase [Ramlibacter henchirensis]TFZ03085.1 methyltransferase domain-containing protein [Ramlibacter henchirensis]